MMFDDESKCGEQLNVRELELVRLRHGDHLVEHCLRLGLGVPLEPPAEVKPLQAQVLEEERTSRNRNRLPRGTTVGDHRAALGQMTGEARHTRAAHTVQRERGRGEVLPQPGELSSIMMVMMVVMVMMAVMGGRRVSVRGAGR